MATVRWTSQALKDLETISSYLSEVSPSYGERAEATFMGAVRRLGEFPRSGRLIPEAEDELLREVLYRDYRIMYFVDDERDEVSILTILHVRREL